MVKRAFEESTGVLEIMKNRQKSVSTLIEQRQDCSSVGKDRSKFNGATGFQLMKSKKVVKKQLTIEKQPRGHWDRVSMVKTP